MKKKYKDQKKKKEEKKTYHSPVLFLDSTAKLRGMKAADHLLPGTNIDKGKTRKSILTKNGTSTCLVH